MFQIPNWYNFFFCKEYYIEYFLYWCYCNIGFPNKITKGIRNIFINILDHKEKRLSDGDESIKNIQDE